MRKSILSSILLLSVFVISGYGQSTGENDDRKPVKKTNQRPTGPARKAEPFDNADVKTMATKCVKLNTEKGIITMEFFPESAPGTVRNFLNLVAIKAYDNTTFSRIVPGFVIQGGDLYSNENITAKMTWRAVRKIQDEPSLIKHERGIVSMARPDEPNSASTDFFILVTNSSGLDGKFAAFGKVINGMELVDTINKMSVEGDKPKKPVRITAATIFTCAPPTQ